MDRARHIFDTKHPDGALNLAPVAEMDDVSERSAPISSAGRLHLRKFTETGHEIGSIGQGCPVEENGRIHAKIPGFG